MQFRTQAGFVFFAVVVAATTEAQNAPRQRPPIHGNPAGVVSSTASPQQSVASASEPTAASSLLDQPAKPAQVGLDSGKLSVKADNSALSDILKNISAKTGMAVDGLSHDQRIFGTYGPAAPREVLSALLDGLGYNVMMVGALDNGAPRELTLTLRTTGNSVSGNSQAPKVRQDNSNSNSDDEDEVAPEQQDTPIPPRPEATYSPEQNQPPDQQQSPANQGQPGQVKTPQQMLQELQQMRQQQIQQQQASPQ
jgi:hypothetical protein